jgi:uncharacterized protein (DUF433 family)
VHHRYEDSVATVVGAVGAGESVEAVERAYGLTREQVLRALRYAADVGGSQTRREDL